MDTMQARNVLNNMNSQVAEFLPPMDMRARIMRIESLPPMPETTKQVLRLVNDPRAGARELSQIVEQDPSLAAQVIRWASSPLYGYRGKLVSLQEAIARVLGFDLVINLALGLAVLEALRVPANGPIGRQAFWRHAIYTATLAERLARHMGQTMRPKHGTIYLAGLLHDLGFLLLGHLFPKEFDYLSRLLAANPEMSGVCVERMALGLDHGILGLWIMENWRMPKELQITVVEHHNPDYRGEFAAFPLVVLAADRLLAEAELFPGAPQEVPDSVYQYLQLDPRDAHTALDLVIAEAAGLDTLAKQMAA